MTPNGLQGIERTMSILEAIADRPMRASEIARELDLKWATTHRALLALVAADCLVHDGTTGHYYIGPRMYYIGSSLLSRLPVVRAAQSPVRATALETSTTAQLVIRYGRRSMNLLVAESGKEAVARSSIDYHFPLHCGSKGQVLLAFAGDDFIDEYLSQPLEKLTRHTCTDPDELRARLERIREEDCAATKGDVQLSTGSVAAPVRDAGGAVVASLTLIIDYRNFDKAESKLHDVVLRTARSISAQLGWQGASG